MRRPYDYVPVRGTLYILCFTPAYVSGKKSAKHYLGFTSKNDVRERLWEHLRGNGNGLVLAAKKAGCKIEVVWTREGTRNDERWRKNSGHWNELCPQCGQEHVKARNATRRRNWDRNKQRINAIRRLRYQEKIEQAKTELGLVAHDGGVHNVHTVA